MSLEAGKKEGEVQAQPPPKPTLLTSYWEPTAACWTLSTPHIILQAATEVWQHLLPLYGLPLCGGGQQLSPSQRSAT